MEKITISVDNTCDLTAEQYDKYNLRVIYFGVVIGDTVHRDIDVTQADVYKAVEVDGLIPKTNAALEVDYREMFEQCTQDGGHIIHLSISSGLSVSHDNAMRASRGLEHVHGIDTRGVSAGIAILAIKASKMVTAGKTAAEIVKALTSMIPRAQTRLILNDLKYANRGGRVSSLKLIGANLLKIRPSLRINEQGKASPDKKFKGRFDHAVVEFTKHTIANMEHANRETVFIVSSDIAPAIADQVYADIQAAGFAEIIRLATGPTLTVHSGRNMIGIVYMDN